MSRARELLSSLVGKPKKVRVIRRYPGEPILNGFVLGMTRDLVLLHPFHDFHPEGYEVIRVRDIKSLRSGKHERFWEKMLRGEGLIDQIAIRYEVSLVSFHSLLTDLQTLGLIVVIEVEDKKTDENDEFYIGRILEIDEWSVTILNFDSLGVWDDEPSVVGVADITKVQFDNPYINIMSKYLKPLKPNVDT